MLLEIEFQSERLWSERVVSLSLMTGVPWPTVRSRELLECGIVVGRRLIGRSSVACLHGQLIYEEAKQAFTKRSKSLLINAPNSGKWWSIG